MEKYLENSQQQHNENERTLIKLYYRNFMSTGYKTDERIIKGIIYNGVTPVDNDDNIQLIIYYQNSKISNLLIKNSPKEEISDLNRAGVVYQYFCNIGECKPRQNSYIGMTTTTLSRRLTSHLQAGTPKTHTIQEHDIHLSREMLVKNTTILDSCSEKKRLQIKEALYILLKRPSMNIQIGSTSMPLPSNA